MHGLSNSLGYTSKTPRRVIFALPGQHCMNPLSNSWGIIMIVVNQPVCIVLQRIDLDILHSQCLGEVLMFLDQGLCTLGSLSYIFALNDGLAGCHPLLELFSISVEQLQEGLRRHRLTLLTYSQLRQFPFLSKMKDNLITKNVSTGWRVFYILDVVLQS